MKQVVVVIGLAGLVCLAMVTGSIGQHEEPAPFPAVDSRLYKACGLDRLTETERENVYRTFQCRATRSYLEEGAVRYMEHNNWREVAINGTVELQLGIDPYPKPYLIAYSNGMSYLLEPSLTQSEFPMPGVYFGKTQGSRWVIVDKRGEVADYWIKGEAE